MQLAQVKAFYEVLISDQVIYEQYFNKCCRRGIFASCHWDKTKIINFAATLGYNFNEHELEHLWFESEPTSSEDLLNSSVYG